MQRPAPVRNAVPAQGSCDKPKYRGMEHSCQFTHTLSATRHALRGWPTPLGGAVNSSLLRLEQPAADDPVVAQLRAIGEQVVEFARMQQAFRGTL